MKEMFKSSFYKKNLNFAPKLAIQKLWIRPQRLTQTTDFHATLISQALLSACFTLTFSLTPSLALAQKLASQAVWPDGAINSSPNFIQSCPNCCHDSEMLFKVAQIVAKYCGYFYYENWLQRTLKISQSGHTVNHKYLIKQFVLTLSCLRFMQRK